MEESQCDSNFLEGEIFDPGNYRPISLTSAVCKVLESVIRESIIEHMTCNHLICNAQRGFLPKRSCVSQLLTSIEYWTDEMQKGNPVDVIYVDFKKAFDKVPHERLLIKLKAYGIMSKTFIPQGQKTKSYHKWF